MISRGFQYFVTGTSGHNPTPEELRAVGLLDVLGGRYQSTTQVEHEGEFGSLVAHPDDPTPNPQLLRFGSRPWGRAVGDIRVRINWLLGEVGERELARRFQPAGERVRLGDGTRWLVPTLLRFDGSMRVAECINYAADSGMEFRPAFDWVERRQLIERVTGWARMAALLGWNPGTIWQGDCPTRAEIRRVVVWALGLAYRVGPDEIDALGLLPESDLPTLYACVAAVADAPAWLQLDGLIERGGGRAPLYPDVSGVCCG